MAIEADNGERAKLSQSKRQQECTLQPRRIKVLIKDFRNDINLIIKVNNGKWDFYSAGSEQFKQYQAVEGPVPSSFALIFYL